MNNMVLCVRRDEMPPEVIDRRTSAFCFTFPEFFGAMSFWYVPRHVAEVDDTFLQIIPYVMLTKGDDFAFVYQRGKKGAEKRLEDKWSVGLGGHISLRDVHIQLGTEELNPVRTVHYGATRELMEEVGLNARGHGFHWECFIYDPETDVGRVHLGLFARLDLDDHGSVQLLHEHRVIEKGELRPFGVVLSDVESFEPWSRAVLQHLTA